MLEGSDQQRTEPESASDRAVLNAPNEGWTYVSFPETTCRDGTPAGLAISRRTSSKKVLIYLEGGGICFDAQTCAQNASNTSWQRGEQGAGIFDRANPANPIRTWNIVYVPYCSGDLHAGDRADVTVPGVATKQQFRGAANLQRMLKPLRTLFADATDVVLTGASAGGYGATLNFVPVQRAFDKVKLRAVDDSGQLLDKASIPTCLQTLWRTTFAWDKTFLAQCGSDCPNQSDFLSDYALWLAKKYADRPLGLISSAQDDVIRAFLGIGLKSCTGVLDRDTLSAATFESSLLRFRSSVAAPYSTYFTPGTQHTFIASGSFYGVNVRGRKLVDWFGQLVSGKPAGAVGL